MVSLDDIHSILMDETDLGTRAIGRALVLLYGSNGLHRNPLGVAMAQHFIKYRTLSKKQLDFWRKPLDDGMPHILKHSQELLILAQLKEQRRFATYNNMNQDVVARINERNDLLDITLDLLGSSESGLIKEALRELRKYERTYGMPPVKSQSIPIELDMEVQKELDDAKNPKKYRDQSNGA